MKDYKRLQNGSDIRGAVIEGREAAYLSPEFTVDLAAAFAGWLKEKGLGEGVVAVGRDSRTSGEGIAKILCGEFAARGIKVYDCGMASTPAMFMSCIFEEINADAAVMITASHLPQEYNGLKFFTKDGGFGKKEISDLIARAEKIEDSSSEETAPAEKFDLISLYSAHLRGVICEKLGAAEEGKPLAGLKIAVDAGNGAGGFYVSKVLEPLGADCGASQFLEPDGTFPNHIPNPENKEAMASICKAVKDGGADLGIIFDTDVDRISAVDSQGRPIARNGIVALSAALIAEDNPGSTVVTDSITSNELHEYLENKLGLKHLRFKRGYKNVIDKAKELENAPLAIETSGHAALKENYYLDDGAYLATKIVVKAAQLKARGAAIEDCIAEMKEPKESVEYRLKVNCEDFAEYADGVLEELKDWIGQGECGEDNPCGGRCKCGMSLEEPNYEGIRVNCDPFNGCGWFLLRKSLHEPLMPLNIESSIGGGAEIIAKKVRKLLEIHDKIDISVLPETE